MNIPENLLYTADHEWVLIEGNVATVGITEYAQSELGDIVYAEIETEEETLDAEETFGSIEAVKTVSDLFMPVAGTVSEINETLEDNPEIINEDPYGAGWLVKLTLEEGVETSQLLSAEAYAAHIG